jgi:SAM-dependent methyltransferase
MTRVLEAELLDELPASDPRAIHSRRDLRRINGIMGNVRALARCVKQFAAGRENVRLAEIGAGDGNVGIRVARTLWECELILVDRSAVVVSEASQRGKVRVETADVFDWLESAPRVDVIIANLFLHHFEPARLRELLVRCSGHCDCFVAAEPRRNRFAEWFAARAGLIGCNEVTRHDAVISVRAGFSGRELSGLWPGDKTWKISERRSGLFTHFFSAVRQG